MGFWFQGYVCPLKHLMTFIVLFYSSYFFRCLSFSGPKVSDFFLVFQTEWHGYFLIV